MFGRKTESAMPANEKAQARANGFIECLNALADDSFVEVQFNGVKVSWPPYTLLTMRHCLHFNDDGTPCFFVETNHWERMKSWLSDDATGCFLDIGAATGAMSVPFDLSVQRNIRLIAFEPSIKARNYLERTIAKNQCRRITVYPYAISDHCGTGTFIEMPFDMDCEVPYLPETSSLLFSDQNIHDGAQRYDVEIRTLDSLADSFGLSGSENVVIKIDVEGFEVAVLRGAESLISNFRPKFSIDIHLTPGQSYDTDQAVRDILKPYGYSFERIGHVVLAKPPKL